MKATPDETLDVLMEIIHREAVRLRGSDKPLSPMELDMVGRLALACARVELAMREPIKPGKLAKLSRDQLDAEIARLEAEKEQRRGAS